MLKDSDASFDKEEEDRPLTYKEKAKLNGIKYTVTDVPPLPQSIMLGVQHYLTMFGSTVAIPLVLSGPLGIADEPAAIAWLIGTMFFVSGITTLLQTTIGNRLPLVQGGTFSFQKFWNPRRVASFFFQRRRPLQRH